MRRALAFLLLVVLTGPACVLLPYPRRGGLPDAVRRQLLGADARLLWAEEVPHFPLVAYGIGPPPQLSLNLIKDPPPLALSGQGSVLIHRKGKLQSLDLATGALQWEVPTPKVYSLKVLGDGEEFLANPWDRPFLVRNPSPQGWRGTRSEKPVCHAVQTYTVGNRIVLFGKELGGRALDVPWPRVFWLARFRGPDDSDVEAYACEKLLVVASRKHLVYPWFGFEEAYSRLDAYDLRTREHLWGADVSGGIISLRVEKDVTLLGTLDGWLLAIGLDRNARDHRASAAPDATPSAATRVFVLTPDASPLDQREHASRGAVLPGGRIPGE
jgi:hypothetical protein